MKNKYNRPESLFDTPLRVVPDDAGYIVYSKSNDIVCQNAFYVDAKRIARLPELYDALMEAAVKYCPELGLNFDSCDTCSVKNCEVREWVNLLRKVRDGK